MTNRKLEVFPFPCEFCKFQVYEEVRQAEEERAEEEAAGEPTDYLDGYVRGLRYAMKVMGRNGGGGVVRRVLDLVYALENGMALDEEEERLLLALKYYMDGVVGHE
ncbi:MAG: hypothetical protein PHU95_07280 [Candidatus Thermoplasmatota archaeon]|nr:hypothetical protein [Candidatus Thermoplasmatota archaeon]MDD5779235.1 hypothetical protein [Candidatus Thermoplasmatota archaeon]